MADSRRKDAIWTVSGRVIRPLDPSPDDIDIYDIAHSLSNQCRFTGHTRKFYSVAQHSVLVSRWLTEYANTMLYPTDPPDHELELWGLLHDASEAYLSDIARPIKRFKADFGNSYLEVEERLTGAIALAFGLETPVPEIVAEADDVLIATEIRDLLPEAMFKTWKGATPLEGAVTPWVPIEAKNQFIWQYENLTGETVERKSLEAMVR